MFLSFYERGLRPIRVFFISAPRKEALAFLHYGIRGLLALIAPPDTGTTTILLGLLLKFHTSAPTAFLFQI